MTSLRFGLNRHFKTKGTDIIQDPEFAEANKVFLAKCVDLKRQGLAKVEHKPAILENDLRKLYECGVFNLGDPRTFLRDYAVLLPPWKAKSQGAENKILLIHKR